VNSARYVSSTMAWTPIKGVRGGLTMQKCMLKQLSKVERLVKKISVASSPDLCDYVTRISLDRGCHEQPNLYV
jgi:hypothetical protein